MILLRSHFKKYQISFINNDFNKRCVPFFTLLAICGSFKNSNKITKTACKATLNHK